MHKNALLSQRKRLLENPLLSKSYKQVTMYCFFKRKNSSVSVCVPVVALIKQSEVQFQNFCSFDSSYHSSPAIMDYYFSDLNRDSSLFKHYQHKNILFVKIRPNFLSEKMQISSQFEHFFLEQYIKCMSFHVNKPEVH